MDSGEVQHLTFYNSTQATVKRIKAHGMEAVEVQ